MLDQVVPCGSVVRDVIDDLLNGAKLLIAWEDARLANLLALPVGGGVRAL